MPVEPNMAPSQASANALAFVGDAVFALYVRERLMNRVPGSAHRLHALSTRYVKASAQARIMHAIHDNLTEEEQALYRRGRNAKTATMPKNADMQEYRTATGFEALLGFLRLSGRQQRLDEILEMAAAIIEQPTDNVEAPATTVRIKSTQERNQDGDDPSAMRKE